MKFFELVTSIKANRMLVLFFMTRGNWLIIGLGPDNHEDYDTKCTLSQNSGGSEKKKCALFLMVHFES